MPGFKAGEWKLYDELVREYEDAAALEMKELQVLVGLMRSLDKQGLEIVGLLIRAYGEDKKNSEIPFGGSHDANSATAQFDLRTLDPTLQRMLIHFGMMHLKEKSPTA